MEKTGTRKGINKYILKTMCDGDLYPRPKRGRGKLTIKVGDKVTIKTACGDGFPKIKTGTVTYIHPEQHFANVRFCEDYGRSYETSFINVKGKLMDDRSSYIIEKEKNNG